MLHRADIARFLGAALMCVCLGAPLGALQDPDALRAAAESGDADAAYRLGRAYQRGRDVVRDPAEGARWVRIAAEQAHAEAQNDLGRSYANGYGVPRDLEEGVRWFRLAAEQGFAVAQ
ncbi:MAG: sel1 repeat family protein, partial [Acidobacteria bacterium]|nr:sel1 repeat family protein [Acidobacteriota bacterium]